MSPLEAGVREACVAMGISPERWRQFIKIATAAIDGFVKALPPELEAQIAAHLASLD